MFGRPAPTNLLLFGLLVRLWKGSAMSYDLDALIAQRKEATGIEGDRIAFTFKGETFTFADPMFLNDAQLDELNDLPEYGPDLCAWFMGEEEYDRFLEAGGSSSLWGLVFAEHRKAMEAVNSEGKSLPLNRLQRRAVARKSSKRH